MAQLVKVIKYFDDGTETVHNFRPNPNAKEIEAKVAEAMMPASEESIEVVDEIVEKPKRKKKVIEE